MEQAGPHQVASGGPPPGAAKPKARIYEINLDEASISHLNANVNHEREVAIFDLLEDNRFRIVDGVDGPYQLRLAISEEQRLVMQIGTAENENVVTHVLSLTPFKRIIKDYYLICDSYYAAIKTGPPSRVQAIDMGRRGLHDEGSHKLLERLEGKADLDFDTARRLFTLISVLYWKG
ncbi:MAG: UPF0262 family protein [Pseudomonadota bacterium]